jgi:hypothetical protein
VFADHVGSGAYTLSKFFVAVFVVLAAAGFVGVARYRGALRVVSALGSVWALAVVVRMLLNWRDVVDAVNVAGAYGLKTEKLGEVRQTLLGMWLQMAFVVLIAACLGTLIIDRQAGKRADATIDSD